MRSPFSTHARNRTTRRRPSFSPTCVICHWSGAAWTLVETRPGRQERLQCPSCDCQLRDRLVWQLLALGFASSAPLRVIEVGGTRRLGDRLRAVYNYVNVDITEEHARVDALIDHGRLLLPDDSRDAVILSYVLSSIPERSTRTRLLSELRRVIVDGGRLLMLDDTDFSVHAHQRLPSGAYFHLRRLGCAVLEELVETGWAYQVVTDCAVASEIGAEREMPYVIAMAPRRVVADGSVQT